MLKAVIYGFFFPFSTQESQYSKIVSDDVYTCKENNLVKIYFFVVLGF